MVQVYKRIPAAKWNVNFQECFPYVVKSSLSFFLTNKQKTQQKQKKKKIRGKKGRLKKGKKNQIASNCLKIN